MILNKFLLNLLFFVNYTKKSNSWGNDLIKLGNHFLGFTNSQAKACEFVNPSIYPCLLVLLQIISQCGLNTSLDVFKAN
jgi:hypothetical protein